MFRRLHRQMTFFCSAVTGAILIGLSIVCLLFARKSMMQTTYTSFQKELGAVLTSLQSQEYLSHQWLRQMQDQHHFLIFLYDNGEPLYYERLQKNRKTGLVSLALEKTSQNIFQRQDGLFTMHEEFPLAVSRKLRYYASAGYVTRGKGLISFVILYDLTGQNTQLAALTALIAAADAVTLVLLVLFAFAFTGRMVLPLEASQKKQQQFVAAASHELRSPLAVILSGLESVEKAKTAKERNHFISLIRQDGLRMQHLIQDMLVLANADARGMELHVSDFFPDELLLSLYEKYEPLALRAEQSLQFVLPREDYECCPGDSERIAQLLSILLDNAISYTPAGGKILLLVTQTPRQTIFVVADNGPSISDEEKSRIFERFYRTDSSRTDHGHYGLGLCTAQEIAEAHGGKLVVTDIPGCGLLPEDFNSGSGAAFCFYLPCSAGSGDDIKKQKRRHRKGDRHDRQP